MKTLYKIKAEGKVTLIEIGDNGGVGQVRFRRTPLPAVVVFSFGGGWDHVSASFKNRCPTWDEMCIIKDIFFEEDECVVQYHPAKKDYVNIYPYCLHLWRPQNVEIPMPPKIFV